MRKLTSYSTVTRRKPMTRATAATKLTRFFRKRRMPARFNPSRSRFVRNKILSKQMSQMSETKLRPVQPFNELAGIPIQTGAIAYYQGFVMQDLPSGWDSSLSVLGGIKMAQGLTAQERIGDYVYFKKTHLSLQVDMNESSTILPPVEFRCIVVKARASNIPAGLTDTPQTSLFLNTIGAPEGYATSGVNGADLMLQPIFRS
jgi:hypothetical protein